MVVMQTKYYANENKRKTNIIILSYNIYNYINQ
uniref:Uncharacterized protein n=1 Tax=viral metagenome TaxID=1070528 RepID=A0A6C0EDV2_9ZZZZ